MPLTWGDADRCRGAPRSIVRAHGRRVARQLVAFVTLEGGN